MCIIAICKSRPLTSKEVTNCWNSNRDGAGFAYRDPVTGLNHLEKGFMLLKDFRAAYKAVQNLPHVVHFRIGTHGAKSPGLTHPFICSADSPTSLVHDGPEPVLFHNGIACGHMRLADTLGLETDNVTWSDTRVVACAVHAHGPDFLCTAGGKYVLIDANGAVWMYGDFQEEDGVLFSNGSYKSYTYTYTAHAPYRVLQNGVWTKYEWSTKLKRYVPQDGTQDDVAEDEAPAWKPLLDCTEYWACPPYTRLNCTSECTWHKGGHADGKNPVESPETSGLPTVTTFRGAVRQHGGSGGATRWGVCRGCSAMSCPDFKWGRTTCTKHEYGEN